MSDRIVYKIEDNIDPRDVTATTYQMRNFYRQLADGFFTDLDVMNYIQHHKIALMARRNQRVLDMCCGRGLLLPFLRYYRKNIRSYTGVDISEKNAIFLHKRVTDGKPIEKDYYPFQVNFVNANVREMSLHLKERYDLIVYTSSIEHMQKSDGIASLSEARKVAKPKAMLVLTCPNTPEDRDGYDTQYAAHVYEWKRSELIQEMKNSGWKVLFEWGLDIKKEILFDLAESFGFLPMLKKIDHVISPEFYLPVFSVYFPAQSKEIGFIAEPI